MFVMRPSEEKLCFPAVRTCAPSVRLHDFRCVLTPACVPAQFPFALPQLPTFRDITRTQGVDQYTLNYHDYCHGRGSATQVTADSLEALGIDARATTLLCPTAAILRGAEAVDSILNAADQRLARRAQ